VPIRGLISLEQARGASLLNLESEARSPGLDRGFRSSRGRRRWTPGSRSTLRCRSGASS